MTGLVLDGCAGAGGFDLGARLVGLDPIGIEWDRDACATRAAAGLRTVRMDIATMATAPLTGRLDGLLASPPCQTYSAAGKGGGRVDLPLVWRALDDLARGIDSRAELTARASDPRSMVVVEPLRFALDCRPRWMVWEQVPPVLTIWRHCAQHLRAAGYWVWTGILNAADFGVAQTRRRAILLASLDGPVGYPQPTHTGLPPSETWDLFGTPERAPWVSMAEALGITGIVDDGHSTNAPTFDPKDGPSRTIVKSTRSWTLSTGTTTETADGLGAYERASERPAPVVTSRADQWTVRSSRGTPTGERCGSHEFDPTVRPAHTVTANTRDWELRVGARANATTRGQGEPAPTLLFGHQAAEVAWHLRHNSADRDRPRDGEGVQRARREDGSDHYLRFAATDPAPVVTTQAGLWWLERPATTIQGDPLAGRPGHKNREVGESQFEQDSVRISIEQAAVLQSFPPDYPFQGTKTARFLQVGNSMPPLLAAHCIAAAAGIPLERERAA